MVQQRGKLVGGAEQGVCKSGQNMRLPLRSLGLSRASGTEMDHGGHRRSHQHEHDQDCGIVRVRDRKTVQGHGEEEVEHEAACHGTEQRWPQPSYQGACHGQC